jgi:hypothetical protein
VLAACGGNIEPMAGLGVGGRSSGLITVREAHGEDVGACAGLAAAAERADDPERARARFQADLGMPRKSATHCARGDAAASSLTAVRPTTAVGSWAGPDHSERWSARRR